MLHVSLAVKHVMLHVRPPSLHCLLKNYRETIEGVEHVLVNLAKLHVLGLLVHLRKMHH